MKLRTCVLGGVAGVSLIGMFVVLLMLQPSVRIVLQILNAIPTAFIGGVLQGRLVFGSGVRGKSFKEEIKIPAHD